MLIPAALQQDTPFGVNLGGSNPQFFPVMPDCEFDSWLTVGPTDGNNNGDISAIGIDFDGWDETCVGRSPCRLAAAASRDGRRRGLTDRCVCACSHQLSIDNGAIFWMDPDNGPAKCPLPCPAGTTFDAVLAQLTLPTGTGSPMHFDAQGNSAQTKRDWEEHCIEVMVGGPNSGAGSHSASGLPMPPDAGLSMAPAKGSSAGAAAVSADCPYTADGSCDEGTGKGKCPAGTDTADCLGAECLSVDTDMINAYVCQACSAPLHFDSFRLHLHAVAVSSCRSCAGKGGMASGSVPDTCTPACAVVYMAWWQRCSPAQELQAADQQMNGGLSEFYSKCVSARGGGH
jgi:hypothetical protein